MILNYALGANLQRENYCVFSVWAPFANHVEIEITTQNKRRIEAEKMMYGYWKAEDSRVRKGDRYFYVLNGNGKLPDPASRFQPEGVHGPSEIIDPCGFNWTDSGWQGIPLEKMIQYELHTGTFSASEDFKGVSEKIPYLKELGINTIELMPVAQFPGRRNWGYDGVFPFAAQNSYGGPAALAQFVDTCHRSGLAVILDVVYNHLGPEGNYFESYGPYFSDRYKTPWGKAVNVDDQYADGMINFIIQNVKYWLQYFHFDGLRLDAVHAIYDFSADHIMKRISTEVRKLSELTGRKYVLIAESNLNDTRYLHPVEKGGYGLDAQWSDDFHHAVHRCVTGEQSGYYIDYSSVEDLAKAVKSTFVLDGVYSIFRKRTFGSQPDDLHGSRFVIFIQNHDHTGNRKKGERLGHLVSSDMQKVACGILFLTPNIPMLFMGEEFNARTPFLYFVSHHDSRLNMQVREGRLREFEDLHASDQDPAPHPDAEDTFCRSKLDWNELNDPLQRDMLSFYKRLISLRKLHPALISADRQNCLVQADGNNKTLIIRRWKEQYQLLAFFNLNHTSAEVGYESPGRLYLLIHSVPGNEKKEFPATIEGNGRLTLSKETLLVYSSWPDPSTEV